MEVLELCNTLKYNQFWNNKMLWKLFPSKQRLSFKLCFNEQPYIPERDALAFGINAMVSNLFPPQTHRFDKEWIFLPTPAANRKITALILKMRIGAALEHTVYEKKASHVRLYSYHPLHAQIILQGFVKQVLLFIEPVRSSHLNKSQTIVSQLCYVKNN